jgi:hypothetical protein
VGREALARRDVTWDPDPLEAQLHAHIHFAKASLAGSGPAAAAAAATRSAREGRWRDDEAHPARGAAAPCARLAARARGGVLSALTTSGLALPGMAPASEMGELGVTADYKYARTSKTR